MVWYCFFTNLSVFGMVLSFGDDARKKFPISFLVFIYLVLMIRVVACWCLLVEGYLQ